MTAITHAYEDLITLFNSCFFQPYNTQLVKGGHEPLYLPASVDHPHHQLIFAHGFFASALHETSHWLIAGEERRQQLDFGYWYVPDGRNAEQQALFQRVEVKPQAMEWILSVAAGSRFRVSIDNLSGCESETEQFKQAVFTQVQIFFEQGLNERAIRFRQALCDFYGTNPMFEMASFKLSEMGS
jgi:elongation factor P hydroxylase